MTWFSKFLYVPHPDESARIRGRNVIIMVLILVGIALLAFPVIVLAQDNILQAFLILFFPTLFDLSIIFLLQRQYISINVGAGLLLTSITLALLIGLYIFKFSISIAFFMILPILVAGLTLSPHSIWLVLLCTQVSMWTILFIHPAQPLYISTNFVNSMLVTCFLIIISLMIFLGTQTAQTARINATKQQIVAEQIMTELAQTNDSLEQTISTRTAHLQKAHEVVQEREALLVQTIKLLRDSQEAVQNLSAPIVPVLPGVIVAPIIGSLTHKRVQLLMHNVLGAIKHNQVRTVILDITGVPVVDTQVAQIIKQTARAAQIMGASTMLVGIRPEVAQVLVSLNVDFNKMRVFANLQQAIAALGIGKK